MSAEGAFPRGEPSASLDVAELRDYVRVNAEVVRALDAGVRRVRLVGVSGQRLLLHATSGDWAGCLVEVLGDAGPELAAGMDAPGLTVLVRGSVADGLARGLRSGRVVVLGGAGDVTGHRLSGGCVIVAGRCGDRPGLRMSGGVLVLEGPAGRLVGEGQTGGRLFARGDALGAGAGYAATGGRLVLLSGPPGDAFPPTADGADAVSYHEAVALRDALTATPGSPTGLP